MAVYLLPVFHVRINNPPITQALVMLNVITIFTNNTRVYTKVPGLAAWSENGKWYSSLPLGTVLSLFYESV
jgi:hypothetical protein